MEVITIADLSKRIKSLRLSEGLTQEEFGKIFGIVKSTVSLYESGKSSPNDEIKKQICKHFGVSLDYLVGLSDKTAETITPYYSKHDLSNYSHISDKDTFLKYWIERSGEDYEKIANCLGISPELLLDYCNEKKDIPYNILSDLSNYLHVSTDCLMGLTIENRPVDMDGKLSFQYNYNIAHRIDELRNPITDTDSFLCILLNISEKELYYLTEYGFVIHIDVIIKLANYFNVSTDYLLYQIDEQDEKALHSFQQLDKDNKDIIIGEIKKCLKEQRYESVAADSPFKKTGTENMGK